MQNLLRLFYEKILLLSATIFRGDYPAIAANCAGEQGAYWEMHDQLFASGVRFDREAYLSMAQRLALDNAMFEQCLDDPQQAKQVDADAAYGSRIGVQGTPAFFIGKLDNGQLIDGTFISGAQSFKKFANVIDEFYGAD